MNPADTRMQPVIVDPNQALAVAPGQVMVMPGAIICGSPYEGDGFAILNQTTNIKIKQKFEMLEALTGWETENEYKVYDDKGKKIFKIKEKSDALSRQLCGSGCRPYDYKIKCETGAMKDLEFLHASREFACTVCCFNRPEMVVTVPSTGARLGVMTDPWACCDMTFNLYDGSEAKKLVLQVIGSCCQCGLFCKCPCGPCESINFDIKDAHTGEVVGEIKNSFTMANMTAMSDADNYEINFGQIVDPRWKAMVMVLAIFLDMRYFEQSGSEQRDNSAMGQMMNNR